MITGSDNGWTRTIYGRVIQAMDQEGNIAYRSTRIDYKEIR